MDERRLVAAGPAERLERWLRTALPGVSRRVLRALIADGTVRVDGRRAAKGHVLRAGAVVTLPDDLGLAPNPDLPVAVLYADARVVVVDKPGGIPAHPLDPRERGTVVNALLARFPDVAPLAGGLAHRLDTGTSGVLLAARSADVWTHLREAFRTRAIEKRYLAIVAGRAPAERRIDMPLAHAPGDRGRMVPATGRGRAWAAETRIRCLASDGHTSLVALAMHTGVTHQLRVHLALAGHPVLGDRRYGGPDAGLPPNRHALHAHELDVPAAVLGTAHTFRSPLPADLAPLLPRP